MKRCPQCRRDYYDDSLLYCLDDGSALLEGPASADEPATAIFSEPPAVAGGLTLPSDESEPRTAMLQPPATAAGSEASRVLDKRLLAAPRLLGILVLGGYFGYRYFKPGGSEQINSIAVLPFENRSGSSDTEYLSDGLADSLIYRLSQLPNLKVSPTSSVMRYKGKGTDASQIAKELNVAAVMSGRLVQIGDSLNISVQLIDVRTDKLLWAEQYDRKMSDLLATQREIATTITQKLKLKLAGEDARGITKKYTDSEEANQLYLKGRHHLAKETKEDIVRSIEYFQQAIKLDPNFALAWVGVADAYNYMPSYGYLSPKETVPKAKVAAQRALEIDPMLAEGHAAYAGALAVYDWNWTESERQFKQALALNPNIASIHLDYGIYHLASVGRSDEAIAELKRANELEPLWTVVLTSLSYVYVFAGQSELAVQQAKRASDLDPGFVAVPTTLIFAYNANGNFIEAISLSEKLLQVDSMNEAALSGAGYAYAKLGRRSDAEETIGKLREMAKTRYVRTYDVASIYAALGERDRAFAELEKSFVERDWSLPRLKVDPFMDPLRSDPRFKEMLRRLNLPE